MSQVVPITQAVNLPATRQALPAHLQVLKQSLTHEEFRICELQYREQPFGRMPPADIILHAKALAIKISIVTGWIIPDDPDIQRVLFDQFAKKIYENYGSLNVQEVEYAIRNNGTQIKDWGKSINLSLVDEALQPYLQKRAEIRKLEESAIKPKELQEPMEPFDMGKLVEDARFVFLKTKLVGLIPLPVYDILTYQKEIELDNDEKTNIRAQVERRLLNEAESEGVRAVVDFKHLKKNNPRDYEIKVRNECKKQAVANFFWKQNEIDTF